MSEYNQGVVEGKEISGSTGFDAIMVTTWLR
jgi:hypothetical protein